jgi:sialic acid synthase SpsE
MKISEILAKKACCFIAEIGLNHNGDVEEARKLIRASHESDCDCVKFQIRNAPSEYSSNELSGEIVSDYIKRTFLTHDQYLSLCDFARSFGLTVFASPWDLSSLQWCINVGFKTIKVPSALASDLHFLNQICSNDVELLISTGMLSDADVRTLHTFLVEAQANFFFMHCQSMYPTPLRYLNLAYVTRLQEITAAPVGYSGHDQGIYGSLMAIEYGARIIEKHITRDRSKYGIDQAASLLPSEFNELTRLGTQISQAKILNNDPAIEKRLLPGEKANRIALAHSVAYKHNLPVGHELVLDDLIPVNHGTGTSALEFIQLKTRRLSRSVARGSLFSLSDVDHDHTKLTDARTVIKSGNIDIRIPVRYRDCAEICTTFETCKVEFHLTRNDIRTTPESLVQIHDTIDLKFCSFHAPDIYDDDLIFSPVSADPITRDKSRANAHVLLEHISCFISHHPSISKIPLVMSISGCDYDSSICDKSNAYEQISLYIQDLNAQYPQIDILPQTLPKYAWYLGGSRDVHFFANPHEILSFLSLGDFRICLDIAHLYMSCVAFGLDFPFYFKKLAPHVGHWHLAGARGVDDEGISLEHSEYDIISVLEFLSQHSCGTVLETWNGHLDSYSGFINDLSFVHRCFT